MGKALWALAFACALSLRIEAATGQETLACEAKVGESKSSKVHEALERRFDLSFDNVPLKDVARQLTELTGVTFYLAAKKLEEASVSQESPVNGSFKNIRLKTWLDLALKEFELSYLQHDDVIVITTPEDLESRLITRVYDCRDLLALPSLVGIGDERPDRGPAGGTGITLEPRRPNSANLELADLIITQVAADSWSDVGGPGAVSDYRGFIVVSQTQSVHDDIERLLDMLREAAGLEKADGRVVR